MFDNILRELGKIKQNGAVLVPIVIPIDDDGYFDRRCPSDNCQSDFKILFEDWKNRVSDAQVFCPICREEAEAAEWNTPDQVEYIRQVAVNRISGIIDNALSQDARDFNRRQPPGFVQVSMTYKAGAPTLIVPISADRLCGKSSVASSANAGTHRLEPRFSAPLADIILLKAPSRKP